MSEAFRQRFISYSTLPATAGFFFVGKKDGRLRSCIDYRGLNKITVIYLYPLSLVPLAIEQIRGASIYTKLDLRSTYNLIRIRAGDEWKTTFSTTLGNYQYNVMPDGLANALPLKYTDVFRDMLNCCVIVYIGEIFIYSRSYKEHIMHVRQALHCLLYHGLYVKAKKCAFHKSEISFIDYCIGLAGVSMEGNKISAVTEWPESKMCKELQFPQFRQLLLAFYP